MARFPRTEPEVIALAEAMITGLTKNAAIAAAALGLWSFFLLLSF